MPLTTLHSLFLDLIKDLYNAEKQLIKALPRLAKAASEPELKEAFDAHLKETQQHATRLEQICDRHETKPTGKTCKAMQGLIEEGEEFLKEKKAESHVRDAALIAAAQKVEHYEIASYGAARTFAQILGNDEDARLLQESLDEEAAADSKLTDIAETINVEAAENARGEE